jgi:hypothetical protein
MRITSWVGGCVRLNDDSRLMFEIQSRIDNYTSLVIKFKGSSGAVIALDELDSIRTTHQM